MNAATRAVLNAEPVPASPLGLARACIVFHDGEWRTAWLAGTEKQPFGEGCGTAREAAAAASYINERLT